MYFPIFFLLASCFYITVSLLSYWSLQVNGFDFSIFDWMLYNQEKLGHMYSPIYRVDHLGVHPSWFLFLLVPLHSLFCSPYFLLVFGPLLLAVGLIPLYHLCRQKKINGIAIFTVLFAFFSSVFVQGLLKDGFRIEMAEPVGFFLFLLAWHSGRFGFLMFSLFALLSIKEDMALYTASFAFFSLIFESQKKSAGSVLVISLVAFAFNIGFARPYFLGAGVEKAQYLTFWAPYGENLPQIILGMLRQPWQVLLDALRSGWWQVYVPFFLIPLFSWRSLAFSLPGLQMLGTATGNPMVHQYRLYYPLPIFCLALYGMIEIYPRIYRSVSGRRLWHGALLVSAFWGAGSVKIRPINHQLLNDLAEAKTYIETYLKDQTVCTQAVAFPYLGFAADLQPLDQACQKIPGTHLLVVSGANPYPYEQAYLDELLSKYRIEKKFGQVAILADFAKNGSIGM